MSSLTRIFPEVTNAPPISVPPTLFTVILSMTGLRSSRLSVIWLSTNAIPENETRPTLVLEGRASRKMTAAPLAASSLFGSKSFASMLLEASIASTKLCSLLFPKKV